MQEKFKDKDLFLSASLLRIPKKESPNLFPILLEQHNPSNDQIEKVKTHIINRKSQLELECRVSSLEIFRFLFSRHFKPQPLEVINDYEQEDVAGMINEFRIRKTRLRKLKNYGSFLVLINKKLEINNN